MEETAEIEAPEQQAPQGGDEPLQKLYTVLHDKGLYTKSMDEFRAKYSDPKNQEKLYSVVSDPEQGLYTKSRDEFISKYFPSQQPSGKQAVQPRGTTPDVRDAMSGLPQAPKVPETSLSPNKKPFADYEAAIGNHIHASNLYGEVRRLTMSDDQMTQQFPQYTKGLQDAKTDLAKNETKTAGTIKDITNGFVGSKDFDGYFDKDGVLDYGKVHDYALGKSKEFGGDRNVAEVIYNNVANAAKFKKLQPAIDDEFKNLTGGTIAEYGASANAKQQAEANAVANHFKKDFEAEAVRSQNIISQKANQLFQSKYQPDLDQIAEQYGQNSPEMKQEVDSVRSMMAQDLRSTQVKENERLLRVRGEMQRKAQAEMAKTGNGDAAFNDLYNKAYQAAQEKQEQDRSKIYDKPLTTGNPLTLFAKSLWSGLNDWTATRGAGLVAAGVNNPITDWMRSRQMSAEKYGIPDLPLNLQNAFNPQTYATRSGKMLGGMIPDVAITALTKSPTLGGLEFWGSSTVSGMGQVYNQAKSEGYDEKEAQEKARDFAGKNVASLPGYLIMSAAIKAHLTGTAGFVKNAVQQSVGGLASSLPQEYAQQSESKDAKSASDFIMQDAPKSALENLVGLAAGAGIMHGIGELAKGIKTPSKQLYSDIIDKMGVNGANAVAELEWLNGKVDDNGLAKNKEIINSLAAIKSGLTDLNVSPDGHKLYLENQADVRALRAKAEAAPDETLRKQYEEQAKAKEKEAGDIIAGKMPYVKFVTRSGMEFTYPIDKATEVVNSPNLRDEIRNGETKVVKSGDPEEFRDFDKAMAPIMPEGNAHNVTEVRHGENDQDAAGLASGQSDIKLNEQGKEGAAKLADELKGSDITKVVSSDINRAKETGGIIADKLGVPHEINTDIRAWDIGDFDNVPDAEWQEAKEYFVNHPEATEFKGKEIGEPFDSYKDRIIKGKEDVSADAGDDHTLLVNHSNNIMLDKAIEMHGGWNEEAKKEYLKSKAPEPTTLPEGEHPPLPETEIAGVSKQANDLYSSIKGMFHGEPIEGEPEATVSGMKRSEVQEGIRDIESGNDTKAAKKLAKAISDPGKGSIEITDPEGKKTKVSFKKWQEIAEKVAHGFVSEKTNIKAARSAVEEQVKRMSSDSIIKKATAIEDLTDPKDVTKQYFAGGGKINPSAIQELFGGKDERISKGAYPEGEKRSRIGLIKKDGPSIDALAHQLWESDKTGKYDTRHYKEAIEQTLQEHNSAGSMARDLIDRHAIDNARGQLTAEEAKAIDDITAKKLLKAVEAIPEGVQDEIADVLKNYVNDYGMVDWKKLEEDKPALSFIHDLSNKAQESLNKLIDISNENEGQEDAGQSKPAGAGNEAGGTKETEKTISNERVPEVQPVRGGGPSDKENAEPPDSAAKAKGDERGVRQPGETGGAEADKPERRAEDRSASDDKSGAGRGDVRSREAEGALASIARREISPETASKLSAKGYVVDNKEAEIKTPKGDVIDINNIRDYYSNDGLVSEWNPLGDMSDADLSLVLKYFNGIAKSEGLLKKGVSDTDVSDIGKKEGYTDTVKVLSDAKEMFKDDPVMKATIDFLEPILKENPHIKIDPTEEVHGNILGLNYPDGRIAINFDGIKDREALMRVVMHEYMHGVTRDEINNNSAFRDELSDLLSPIREYLKLPENGDIINALIDKGVISDDVYGASNEHELLAEVFTNQKFYDMLKEIKYKGDSLLKTLFNKIASWFSSKYKALNEAKSGITADNFADYLRQLTENTVKAKQMPVSEGEALPARSEGMKARSAITSMILEGKTEDNALEFLKRKGYDEPSARAMLGDAKTKAPDPEVRESAQKEVTDRYNKKEDEWLGNKEWNRVSSKQEARDFQNQIKKSVPKGESWKDVDKAIHLYLDTQRNPAHAKEFGEKLQGDQKKIFDLSQNLTADQKDIAEKIKKQYEEVGKMAKDEGIIKDALDNYVARAWEMNGKPATEQMSKFKTNTKHSLQRSLDTILQGYAEGMKLKIEGASNNLQVLKEEIGNVVENRRLLDQGLKLKYDSGETDDNGKPVMKSLFSNIQEDGYKRIENPFFRKWEYQGKLDDYSAEEKQAFGRRKDILVGENGEVMKKADVYAPEDVAKSLNNILGHSTLRDNALVQGITKFSQATKQSILSYSGFHFIAFARAHALTGAVKDAWNPISSYKEGLSQIHERTPEIERLVKNGLTISRQQDFQEGLNSHQNWLARQMDKNGYTKPVKDAILNANHVFHRFLFESFGAGLKAFDGISLYKKELIKNPTANPDEVAARVSKVMNDTYGGINWERMRGSKMQDPTNRHLVSLALLAPDWTASNIRFAKKAISSGDEGSLYRKMWTKVLLRAVAMTGIANMAMTFMDETDDDGNPLTWQQAWNRRYGKAWDAGKMRASMVDITPLYHYVGGDENKRAYFSIFGAYTDPIKMVTNPGLFVENKGSFVSKLALETFTSQDWQGRQFTDLDELLGMDDKGTYTKAQQGHNAGDTNPRTGNPYKKNQMAHEEGDPKGGKMAGQFTKWPNGGSHPVQWGQVPSFIGSQVRGMLPSALQNTWMLASGENDALTSFLNAIGSQVATNKDKSAKPKETTTSDNAPVQTGETFK